MKKITLLLLTLGFTSLVSAQCLTADFGQYPTTSMSNVPYSTQTCDGLTVNTITTLGYASEYSSVLVSAGETYTFSSSNADEVVTISADAGATAAAYGIGSVTWVATVSGEVWFYTNLNDGVCSGDSNSFRTRSFVCGTPPTCLAPTAVTAANMTTTSVDISWTASTSAPANGYEYYVSSANTAPTASTTPTGTVGAGLTTVNVAGLTSGTIYFVWVRSVCSGTDSSAWSSVASFTTVCDLVTDFSENFDSIVAFPACWAKVGTAGYSYVQASGTTTSLPNNLYIYSTDATSQAVVAMKPVSNAGDGTHRLRFRARGNYTAGDTLEVGYLTDPLDDTTFTAVQSFVTTSTTVYDYFTAYLGTAPGSNQVLAFRHAGVIGASILIDDVVWEAVPSCLEPTALTVTNVTTTTATVSWTASASTPANGYEYAYSTSNTTPTAALGSVGAGVTTVNLSGLTDSSVYYVWVRSVCSSSDSSVWSIVKSFTTKCPSATVPYTQDFESATVPAIPSCTSLENAGAGNNWTVSNNPGYGFTTNALTYSWNSANDANAWFYTNGITLVGGTTYTITYNYGNNSTFYVESLKVAYGTDATSGAMTTVLADYPSITGATQAAESINFTPAVSGDYYFGFNAYSIADQYRLYVDDITITTALGTSTFNNNKFTVYPNPVKEVLNIGYNKTIVNVAVYNLLGQEVLVKAVNTDQSQINVANLSKGTYLVKVTAEDGATKVMKVVKE